MTLKEKFIKESLDIKYQILEPEKFEQIANDYAIEFKDWCDNFICQYCNNEGYIIEVEAECCMREGYSCMREGYSCCGIPNPIQVQKQCYCSSITTQQLLQIFKKEKGL